MDRNLTPHTWIHRDNHPSSKCTGILPLTHECTANRHSSGKCPHILPLTHECNEIIIPQVNAPESYPSYMNAPQIVIVLRKMYRYPTPHAWMHRNHHPSSKCTGIVPLTQEGNNRHSPGKWTSILPLTHECTEIIIPQVNALISYPSHMKAQKLSSLK